MVKSFSLSAAQHRQIVDHARAGQPNEICGLIGGWQMVARMVIPLPNVAREPRSRYQVDPEAFISAYRQLEQAGTEVIGLYHSHPSGSPIPSAVDIAEATWPEATYVIVGFAENQADSNLLPMVAAWSIRRGMVSPIALIVTD